MRVSMYYNNGDIRLEEMPVPKIGPGELLMRVDASGICGSDLMEWYRLPKAPLVLGHETTGEVVEVGEGVEKFKTGDRIVATHHVPCNTCHYCLRDKHSACQTLRSTKFDPGGFAEFVRLPAINVDRGVFTLPDNVSYGAGSFAEPLGCVVRGQRVAGFEPGGSVLVMGSGITGLLHIQLSAAMGAGKIFATDINGYRLEAARKFGADLAIDAGDDVESCVRDNNGGRLADYVVVCTGAPAVLKQAFDLVEMGGGLLYFAPSSPETRLDWDFNARWGKGLRGDLIC